MRSCKVELGVVVDVIIGKIDGFIECIEGVGIGWGYDGSKFTAPEVAPADPPSAKDVRDSALTAMVHDFGDGRAMQVRPVDLGNIMGEISRMARKSDEPQSWRMIDNAWHDVTIEELQEALESGQDQGREIWNQYRDDTQ